MGKFTKRSIGFEGLFSQLQNPLPFHTLQRCCLVKLLVSVLEEVQLLNQKGICHQFWVSISNLLC